MEITFQSFLIFAEREIVCQHWIEKLELSLNIVLKFASWKRNVMFSWKETGQIIRRVEVSRSLLKFLKKKYSLLGKSHFSKHFYSMAMKETPEK